MAVRADVICLDRMEVEQWQEFDMKREDYSMENKCTMTNHVRVAACYDNEGVRSSINSMKFYSGKIKVCTNQMASNLHAFT